MTKAILWYKDETDASVVQTFDNVDSKLTHAKEGVVTVVYNVTQNVHGYQTGMKLLVIPVARLISFEMDVTL